ncbi:C4-dicarboxylate ABC transporter substrate-binding protein [Saccharospirillum sp. MSK14-1]|uniref:TRAP transporter small permease subunit n=1 Tax=Saccharospirillum sp. MSK14-1 TaxID=1897632 RepID=UPI000D3DBC32|nr:TRAP transporter small permease [Saccharospirillum sp. MSK14-1]PTY38673.1 C4-dicarboxylate ABC transporter substrate-binding protein [Saccharospirillum sp. MSK14-1]
MAGSSTVLTDASLLSRMDRLFYRLETALTLVGGAVILALVFVAVANVLGRWLFNMPLRGYIDWVEQLMAVFAFFGIAYCQRLGGHIRMDLVIGALKGRRLWLAEFTSVLLMLAISIILAYGSYLHFLRAYTNGDSSIDIGLPTWPAKLVVPVMLTLLSLRLLLQLWGYARALRTGSDKPVAVPLIEDAATVAQREAESLEGLVKENDDDR